MFISYPNNLLNVIISYHSSSHGNLLTLLIFYDSYFPCIFLIRHTVTMICYFPKSISNRYNGIFFQIRNVISETLRTSVYIKGVNLCWQLLLISLCFSQLASVSEAKISIHCLKCYHYIFRFFKSEFRKSKIKI